GSRRGPADETGPDTGRQKATGSVRGVATASDVLSHPDFDRRPRTPT
ncbi:uncharacterized protein METZ01_LOCUS209833, partial [marine metagenome]